MSDLSFPPMQCLCGALRRVERMMTRLYEQQLRAVGLSIGQYSLLTMLENKGPLSQQQLGDMLAMDKATLSRNVQPLLRDGLVSVGTGTDRRIKYLTATEAGRSKLQAALPHWKAAQKQAHTKLKDDFPELLATFNELPNKLCR